MSRFGGDRIGGATTSGADAQNRGHPTGGHHAIADPLLAFMLSLIIAMLIVLEFKHSIVRVAMRRESIVQVKTVVLIALLALSRKFVILDASTTGPAHIAALAFATLVLGAVYWLLRERDDRMPPQERTDLEQG